jgi:hypothetical protein
MNIVKNHHKDNIPVYLFIGFVTLLIIYMWCA